MTPTDKQQAKFTPGPWRLHHRWPDDVVDATGALVVSAYGDYESPQTQANAHLISAAPDLYAFVQKQFDEMNCICKGAIGRTQALMGTNVPCTKCEAETLLAKARGQK